MAQRVAIVLAAAAGKANQEIASQLGIHEVTVGKWRRAFVARGLDGLQDATRSGRPAKYTAEYWQKVPHRVCQRPEYQSRWSVRTLAQELGMPRSTMH